MKILLYDKKEHPIGGMGVYSQRFIAHARKRGHRVHVLRYSNEVSTDPTITHIPYYLAEPRLYVFVPAIHAYAIIKHTYEQFAPDIIYADAGLSPLDFLLPSLAKTHHTPLATVMHADYNESKTIGHYLIKASFALYAPFCRNANLLQVFSKKMKTLYEHHGVRADKIIVLPNGVDPTVYTRSASSFGKKHTIKTGVLFLGRLSVQKNPEIAIKAFLQCNPPMETKMVIVGPGDLLPMLKAKYTDPRIIFTGPIYDEQEKIDIIRSCHIMLQPSFMEGMSLALMEAMACGLTAITSDAGNNAELLKNTGEIIPLSVIDQQLAPILRRYLDNPGLLKKHGAQSRATICKHFVLDTLFDRLLSRFQSLI